MSPPTTSVPRPEPERDASGRYGPTVGVEEEFLLVDAGSGRPAPLAPAVLRRVTGRPGPAGTRFQSELRSAQVEAASGVCAGLDDLAAGLTGARAALAAAAEAEGAHLLSTGTPVLAGPAPVSAGERFARVAENYAGLVDDYLSCGCHVHVGVADRDTAVAVVNHLRPWLPTLLALSVNSIFDDGRDTGYASWRVVQQTRFPGYGVPPVFSSAAEYDEHVARLVDCGSLVDPAMSFWLARPSVRYPTVEVRTADAAGTVGEAVLQAALTRALVGTALVEIDQGRPAAGVRPEVAATAVWSAARYGLRGFAVHPRFERRVPAVDLVRELLDVVAPALAETGDTDRVRALLDTLVHGGTGAERQRRAARRGPAAVIDMLVTQTAPVGLMAPVE